MNRRVEKLYSVYSGTAWVAQSGFPQRYVYDGWNVVLTLNSSNAVVRKSTWGLDLSGTPHGAGGIGGLLANAEGSSAYWFFYDGNGNVTEVVQPPTGTAMSMMSAGTSQAGVSDAQAEVSTLEESSGLDATGSLGAAVMAEDSVLEAILGLNASGTLGVGLMATSGGSGGSTPPSYLLAHYEYDAYGNCLYPTPSGSYATVNPFRFSTKWCDYELGSGKELYYYGYRYYNPRLGRWISRDPAEEKHDPNLFAFVRNRPPNARDKLGLATCTCPEGHAWPVGVDMSECYAYGWGTSDDECAEKMGLCANCPLCAAYRRSHDRVELHCYSPIRVGSQYHCDVKCTEGQTGEVLVGGGTGSASSGGGVGGDGGDPSWRVKPDIKPGSKYGGSAHAPAGTCKCLSKKGNKINQIKGKIYDLPGYGNISNSNALLSTLLTCCGVNLAPSSAQWTKPVISPAPIKEIGVGVWVPPSNNWTTPGWGHSVEYGCGCTTEWVSSGVGAAGGYYKTTPTRCKIGCKDLQ